MSGKKEDLKTYLMPPAWPFFVAAAVALLFIVFAFAGGKFQGASLFLIALGLLFGYLVINEGLKARRRVREYEESGKLREALPDFDASREMLGGQLRLGEQNLYGKKMGLILPYSDIARMYQYVHKTNFVEDNRLLIALTRNGKRHNVCKLERRGKSDTELSMVLAFIRAKNPDIQFGYAGR